MAHDLLVKRTRYSNVEVVEAATDAGRAWLTANVADAEVADDGTLPVDHRYIDALVGGAVDDGLQVQVMPLRP